MQSLEHSRARHCDELKEKLLSNAFNLVVVGQFKRGKTCLINALLGKDILPVAVVPLTSIVTILVFGEVVQIRVFFNDGAVKEIDLETLAEYVTESGNPKNAKNVREVLINYPSPYLKDGVHLIDTPGVGSVYRHNTDVAYRYLPQCDAALFLLSVEQPASQAELDFLRDVRQYSDRIFFLLNKIDYLSEPEIRESIAFSQQVIREAMGTEARLFPVSAKLALEAKRQDSSDLASKSRLPEFSEVLDAFLLHEKGKVLLLSAVNTLSRMLSEVNLELELEQRSLTTPIEELREKIELFERKKEDVLIQRRHFELLLEGELDNLVKTGLEEDLAVFKSTLTAEMEKKFDAFYEQNRELPLKELNTALEGFIVQEIQRAFTAWYAAQDEKLAAAFEAASRTFVGKMDDIVDELLEFSSQLFSVPFKASRGEGLWTEHSSFYYKLREDAVGLDMLATSLTEVVPGLVSNRFARIKEFLFRKATARIYRKRKEFMLQAIDMQAGRMRYDFVERLKKSKQGFRREMLQRIDATTQGLGAAIEKGMSRRARGEAEAMERQAVLAEELRKLDAIKEELREAREALGAV